MNITTNDLWISQIFKSSVPLRRLNDELLPTGIASGCLIDYSNKRILLTVAHATGDQKNWTIELSYEKGLGTKCFKLGAMFFLKNFDLTSGNIKDIDFSYTEVPNDLLAYRQKLDIEGNVLSQVPIHVFTPDFEIVPDKSEKYGFAGSVKPNIEYHFDQPYVSSEFVLYSDLTYERQDEDFYVFKLPIKHPGHKYFKGCSGAPVIDSKGRAVALICHGNEESDEIYAIPIKMYKVPIDILVGNI